MSRNRYIYLALGLFILVVALRLAPHAPNFVPVGALALFAGAYFPKRWGYGVPLAAVLATDVLIGFYDLKLMAVVYLSHLLGVGLGYLMRSRVNTGNVLLGAVGGAVAFFLTTNFAVWLFSSWYAHTLPGLLLAYEYGLPFFRNTLLSNLVYSGAFFGVYEFAKRYVFKPGSELTKARA